MTREFDIVLPSPHIKQTEFINSPAKRKVIVAGRRGGKTTGVSMIAAIMAMNGRRVLEAAPVQDQTEAFWEAVKSYFSIPIAQKVIDKNETERRLTFPSGGQIRAKTAFNADTLRGDYADLLILDEYSYMQPDTWEKVGAPMLLDNDGDAVFIFTPNRRNHAYHRYMQAEADDTGRWAAWHFTSLDNPYLSRKALDDITKDMSEEDYKQEVLAEFLENEGQVFRNIDACMNAPATTATEHRGHIAVMGVDYAKQQDYTVISIGCATCGREVYMDRFNQVDYVYQNQKIQSVWHEWDVKAGAFDSASIGEPNLDYLKREKLAITGIPTNSSTQKAALIEALALALDRTAIQFLPDKIGRGELEAYERTMTKTGLASYSAPTGLHDDTVIARALMWRAMQNAPRQTRPAMSDAEANRLIQQLRTR